MKSFMYGISTSGVVYGMGYYMIHARSSSLRNEMYQMQMELPRYVLYHIIS